MTRKKLLLLISILFTVMVIVLVGGYFYLTSTKVSKDEPAVESTGSLADTSGDQDTTSVSSSMSTSSGNVIPKLRHLTTTPVAGYDFVDTPGGFVAWYVDRATGNIFQTATDTLETTRITNTTIPKVYEAYIGKGGASVILRTLNDTSGTIQTFIGSPKAKTNSSTSTDSSKDLVGVFTNDVLSSISLSPAKDKFFGISGITMGLGNIYSFTTQSSNIFSNQLKRWDPQWLSASAILLTSAPSARTQNISYILNPLTRSFTKLLGPKNGLVVSGSSNGSSFLYSENKGDSLVFGVYDNTTHVETPVTSATIPDKCVWSKKDPSIAYCGFPKNTSGVFPDDWYQGKVSFNDTLRALDTHTLQFTTISDLGSDAGTPIDATNLMLSKDEKYLLFTNKRDLTLWMLEL